ncbi:rab3 GTPase-activating protein non-catalytic subunit [Elysia marginata]|uniref:Rab3 GTPase-activating protein non-catalytic subunit n=1 Tax=Elysia marginata TaxID=1093978 RepID=A0AAV4HYN5_9GAST|nr:rab3 GTPase-activating protein non-catalytic subunit [Elysia marginata]
MSCQLSAISKFHDISALRRFLFPNSSKEGTPTGDAGQAKAQQMVSSESDELDNWDQDWGFDESPVLPEREQEISSGGKDEGFGSSNWLQKCVLSISPTNDVVAVAYEHKICVLTRM